MSIKRYRVRATDGCNVYVDTEPDGYWVRYEDHATEVERLTREIKLLNRERDEQYGRAANAEAERDEMRAMWDKDSAARHRLLKEVERLRASIPDPDDLRAVLELAYAWVQTSEDEAWLPPDSAGIEQLDRVRATLDKPT